MAPETNVVMFPMNFHDWPIELQLQWAADELWSAATQEQDPAPAHFVEIVDKILLFGVRRA